MPRPRYDLPESQVLAWLAFAPIYQLQELALQQVPHEHPELRKLLRMALFQGANGDHQGAFRLLQRARKFSQLRRVPTRERAAQHRVSAVVYLGSGLLPQADRDVIAAIALYLADADLPGCIRSRIVSAEIYLAMRSPELAREQLIAVLDNLRALHPREVVHVGRLDIRISGTTEHH